MKYATLKANEALAKLASIERLTPGRLASWVRAHPPEHIPQHRAVFCTVVNLNPERK